jgi:hypothetical protein
MEIHGWFHGKRRREKVKEKRQETNLEGRTKKKKERDEI